MSMSRRTLRAGPIRLTLVEGELRYLYVGDREIVRRVYFTVRWDNKWDTAPTEITALEVDDRGRSFEAKIAARCRVGSVDYGWSAVITGSEDGTIRFAARGASTPGAPPSTNVRRTGLCVLLGAEAVVDQTYVLSGPAPSVSGRFAARLTPEVIPAAHERLRTRTAEGLDVEVAFTGAPFGLEDQRNFHDSSFKLFSGLAHRYPDLAPGDEASAEVLLRIGKAAAPAAPRTEPPRLRLGQVAEGSACPRLVPADPAAVPGFFMGLHKQRDALREASEIAWGFSPAVNLHDDDTLLENVSAVLDQARTARDFVDPARPRPRLRVAPISLDPVLPRPARDPRNGTAFGAAFSVALFKYLALGAVDEAAFQVGLGAAPSPARTVQETLCAWAGKPVRPVSVEASDRPPVEAFAVDGREGSTLVLANVTNSRLTVLLEAVPRAARRLVGAAWEAALPGGPSPSLPLAPYDVWLVEL